VDSLKILYISSVDVSLTKGPSANEREFIPILNRILGGECHFIIPKPQDDIPSDLPINNCTFIKSHNERTPIHWIIHQFSLIIAVHKKLKSEKYDFILARFGVFPFAYWFIAKFYKIPFAVKHASDGKLRVFDKKKVWKPLSGLNRYLFKSIIKHAFVADVVSTEQREKIKNLTGEYEKIIWVDNGANIQRFKPKENSNLKVELRIDSDDPVIGYVGNLAWERGADQIIEGLQHLKVTFPNVKALIVGDGKGMETLKEKAKNLGVLESCIFTGRIPYEEVPAYINCLSIGVSLRDKKTKSDSELKVRQYLACGKPVILTPGSNNFVEDAGIGKLVDYNNLDEFTDAITFFLKLSKRDFEIVANKARSYAVNNLSYESKVEEKIGYWKHFLKQNSIN